MAYKYTIIEKKHRKAIESLCISMNLVDVTTEIMHKRGSIRLWDPVAAVYYSLHESGYVRRHVQSGSWYRPSYKAYQLNQRDSGMLWGNPATWPMGMDEQIITLINAVPKYRQTIFNRA
jgi:hypothetical protein